MAKQNGARPVVVKDLVALESRLDGKLGVVEARLGAVERNVGAVERKVDAVERKVDEAKSQSQTQFEALRDDIRLLADHMVRVEEKFDRHVEQNALGHAQIRTEMVAGDAALDRRVRTLEERAGEGAG